MSYDFALVRYNTDGSLDTGFGNGGIVTTVMESYSQVNSVTIQSDGKIVAAGYSDNGSSNDFTLVRYNTDGLLDVDFGSNGIVTTAIGSGDDEAKSIVIQNNGKIVVTDRSDNGSAYGDSYNFALVRYNPDGFLDTGFGSNGIVTTAVRGDDDRAYDVAIQSDGEIVVAGSSEKGSYADFALVRYEGGDLMVLSPIYYLLQ